MIMFALLLANGTHDDLPAVLAGRPAAEPAGAGRRIRPEPRSDLGGRQDQIAKTVPAKDRFKPAGLSGRRALCSDHRLLSTVPAQAWSAPTTPSWRAQMMPSSYAGWLTWRPTARRKGRACKPRSFPRFRRLLPTRSEIRRRCGRAQPEDRRCARHGDQPGLRPNDIASHDIEAAGKAYDRLASNSQHRCPTEPPARSIPRARRSSW